MDKILLSLSTAAAVLATSRAMAQVTSTPAGPTGGTIPITVTVPVAVAVQFEVPSDTVTIPASYITPGAVLTVEAPVTNTGGLPIGINIDPTSTLPDWLTYTKPPVPLIMPAETATLDLLFTVADTLPEDAAEVLINLDINGIQIGPTPAPAPVSL